MEESDLTPEETNESNSLSQNDEDLMKKSKEESLTEASSEKIFLTNKDTSGENISSDKSNKKELSLFNRFLKEGFDGITTNPNYKLLALLIILLINLSLFLFVGNLGKSFLQNSGILN